MKPQFTVLETEKGCFVKAWNNGVPFDERAVGQLKNTALMPFIQPYIAAMPDTHWGMGSTVGSVIPTEGAIMPAAVGVDIGCGMMACRTNLDLACTEQDAEELRRRIEVTVPHGRTNNGGEGDRGAWHNVPDDIADVWNREFLETEDIITLANRHPGAISRNTKNQLGTLGTGNHFIEVCRDVGGVVWVVLHSGSRGFGNRIGTYFTQLAKEKCKQWFVDLPDPDLAYLPRGTDEYDDYLKALHLAQIYAWRNREIMMERVLKALEASTDFQVHCHHNYMAEEVHFGKKVLLTRKGAVRAMEGDMVVIPGSMGARTFIARGLGSVHSFHSCSHGAGRTMSRTEALKRFTVEDHIKATEGVSCHKGAEVIDETPGAYKDIDAVMAAQIDLVEPVFILKQLLCVKGLGDNTRRNRK